MMLKTSGKYSMVAIFSLIACLRAVERIVINSNQSSQPKLAGFQPPGIAVPGRGH